jgi:nitrate/nitrite-specific signal transduction histidine kinase
VFHVTTKTAKPKTAKANNPAAKRKDVQEFIADMDKVVAKVTQEAENRALLWWGWAQAALLSIAQSAEQLANEVERPGSQLAGLFDASALREFASLLPDASTDLGNAIDSVAIPQPLAEYAEGK